VTVSSGPVALSSETKLDRVSPSACQIDAQVQSRRSVTDTSTKPILIAHLFAFGQEDVRHRKASAAEDAATPLDCIEPVLGAAIIDPCFAL